MGKDLGTGTVINAQKAYHLEDGDRITAPIVSSAGVLGVHSGGTATNIVESGGLVIVDAGGTATFAPTTFSDLTLSSANLGGNIVAVHTATVHSGTTANRTTLLTGYDLEVYSGGTANSTTVNYGCLLRVLSDGTANDTDLGIIGSLYVSKGGVANRTSGGFVLVFISGTVNSTTVDRYMLVHASAIANSTTILDGQVIVDGVMNDTTISGGSMEIFSGAAANRTAVRNGGLFNVSSGGTATSARVETGGSMQVFSSGLAKSAHLAGGRMTVSFGGTATSAVVSAGNLYLDGIAVSATVSGGSMEVFSATGASSGGTATATTVKNGGFFFVSPDAVASNTKIAETGSMIVSSDATADNTSMTGAGAYLSIENGAVANSTTVSKGNMFVSGTANAGAVTVEGGLFVAAGGQANEFKVSKGGALHVRAFGTATAATVTSAELHVSASGAATGATVRNGGVLDVSAGGAATNTLLTNGGSAKISGNAENTTVNQNGVDNDAVLTVFNGGKTMSTTINSMGYMHISNGGQATSTTVNYGGLLYVSNGGQATSSFVEHYGSMYVLDGGQASGARVSSGGYMHVSNGGKASNTFLYGGNMFASAGATVTNAMALQGATLRAYAGAGATGIVEAGGYVDLADGVTATFLSNTFKELTLSNESATVHSMTKAVDITLANFGSLTVYSGGTATGTTLNGGRLRISAGGIASNTTVTNGDFLVSSGGKATGVTTIAEGRTCQVIEGGIFDFDISAISPANAALVNNLALVTGTPTFTLTVSDAQANGTYVLAGGSVDFGETISVFNTSGTELGTISVAGGETDIGGVKYTLAQAAGNKLTVTIKGAGEADLTGDLNTKYDLAAGMVAANVNVNENGELNVLNGGAANNTTVNSGGELNVSSGGVATGVTVNSGGWLRVSAGGTATGIDWQPCTGDVYVEDGGSATFVSSYSGVYYGEYGKLVRSAATMYGEMIDTSSFEMYVMDGGLAEDTEVECGGNVFVWSGGTASNTRVEDHGCLLISSGGTASNTRVEDHGCLLISSGGTASNTRVAISGGLKVFTGGTASDTNVEAFGEFHIFTNAVATGRMKFEDGAVVSAYDGSVFDFDISALGPGNAALVNDLSLVKGKPDYTLTVGAAFQPDGMYTLAGGATGFNAPITVTDTLGTVLGTLTVGSGETDIGDLKYALALDGSDLTVTISGGGTVITGDIAGETKNVYKGWTAQDVNINAGGRLDVLNGGEANNTTVNSSGFLVVQSGGTAEVVTVNPGGGLEILNGGAAYQIRENGGYVYCYEGSATFVPNAFTGLALESWVRATVHSGTTATDVSVASGGHFEVYAGGSAAGIVAEEGANLYLTIAAETYAQGTYAGSAFETGSSVTGIEPRPDFKLDVGSGGTAGEIGIGSQSRLKVSSGGTAVDVTVELGGTLAIASGGSARNVTENGGYVDMSEDADVTFASHTITGLVFSTVATIHSGTTATHATVKTGPVFVYGGGIVSDTTTEDSLYLEGGVATDTTVNNKGTFYINSGVATGTIVNSKGTLGLYGTNNIAVDTTVNDGGYFSVTGGNTANGVVVSSGGSLNLAGGKLTGKAVFETGAIVTPGNATIDFDLTQTKPGADPLVNDLSFVMDPSTTYTLTVNGTVVNGTYSLAGGATGFDKTITVNNTLGEGIGTLSVGDVEKEIVGMQFSLALNGSDLTVTVAGGSEPDTTAPTVSNIQASITTPTNQNVTVTADFDDDVALKSRLYRLEGDSDWSAYPEGGVVVTENTTVYFKSVDTSGNECKPKFITIDNIDKVAPTITGITPSTTAPATSVTVTAVFDDDVELSTTLYRIGDGGWFNYNLEGVTVTTNTTVYFKATDTAGNATTASYDVTNIDTSSPDITPPTITVTPSTTKPTTSVTVSAVFSDDVAVATKQYRVGDGDWKDYSDPVPVTENVTVGFRATDTSGNATVENYLVTNIENEPENDKLYNKKTGWADSENIATFSVNEVVAGDSMVYLDKKGSVESEDGKYFNSLGRTQTESGTAEDAADYAKIELAYGAELKFSVDSTVGGTFYVYQATTDKKGDLVAAQRQKIAVKAGKTSPAKLSAIYLEAGEYFVGMEAKLPAAKKNPEVAAYYNVTLAGTKFYVDADEGTNNTANDYCLVGIGRGSESKPIVLDTAAMTGSTKFKNFVGFTDGKDFIKLDLASPACLSFHVTGEGDGKAKFTVWKQDASGKLSKVTNVSLPAKKAYDATTKAQFLDADKYTYYISMECTDEAKGKSLYYNVEVADGAVFFDSADDGKNDVLYDKKAKEFCKEDADHHFESTSVGLGTKSVRLDSSPVGEPGYENFVGYGDAADYAKIKLTSGGKLSFQIEAAGDATFTFYRKGEKKGVETLEAVQSVKLAVAKGETTVAQTMDVSTALEAGEYYVSMVAKNTKPTDKGSVFYNVTATLALPDASALEMPMAAAAYADSSSDKLFGESGNGILASLA